LTFLVVSNKIKLDLIFLSNLTGVMSKLSNAPLVEVIFELRWDIISKPEIIDFQYLHGDLYSFLREKYPFREILIHPEIPHEAMIGMPIFRFRVSSGEYPLIQIGPGLVSFNTIDNKYSWEEFSNEISNIVDILYKIYPKLQTLTFSPALTYINFFEYDKEKVTAVEFINSNLQLSISENFIFQNNINLDGVNLNLNYKKANDILSLILNDGKINNDKTGIILQTKLIGEKNIYTKNEFLIWLASSHEFSSDIFKSLTKGELYTSFQ